MRNLTIDVVMGVLLLGCIAIADTHIPAGDVFGTWTFSGSPYLIEGEITIPIDSTLNIQPGVAVIFQGHYKFIVHGILEAVGTESDSILFTAADTSIGWHGIRFIQAAGNCQLSYCVIQNGIASGTIPDPDVNGGGIFCDYSNPTVSHCAIRRNNAVRWGGGIFCQYSHPNISYCTIIQNTSSSCGGIGCVYDAVPNISYCVIKQNHGYCGGGIGSDGSSNPIISYCDISENTAARGGGIFCANCTFLSISNCVISNNSVTWGGGIHDGWSSSATIRNCTITGNSATNNGAGIYCYGSSSIILNTIVAHNTGNGSIEFYNSQNVSVIFGDFFDNIGGNFSGNPPPQGLGTIDTVNANGDSCDTYFNIFLDPMFVDTSTGNYHLQGDSPCIDAGDPTSPRDPDGTIADIGAFYYPHSGIPNRPPDVISPTSFRLFQNYPNPFNSSTTISLSLPIRCKTDLNIYDITGRQIATLVDDWRDAGIHRITFDASMLSSGIYFYQLKAGNFTDTKKMVFIK